MGGAVGRVMDGMEVREEKAVFGIIQPVRGGGDCLLRALLAVRGWLCMTLAAVHFTRAAEGQGAAPLGVLGDPLPTV